MTMRLALVAVAVLVLGLSGVAQDSGPSSELPAVVAQIGDEVITGAEFQRDLSARLMAIRLNADPNFVPGPNFHSETLDELVNGKIIRLLAQNAGITVSEEDAEARHERGKRNLGSEEAFAAFLRQQGYSEESLRSEIRATLITERWRERESAGATVTAEEVRTEYDLLLRQNGLRRPRPTKDLRLITVKVLSDDPASPAKAREQVEAARERILAGSPFEEVAREISDDAAARQGGLIRDWTPGRLPPKIEERVAQQPEGWLSDAFQSPLGWHLTRVEAVHGAGVIPFEEMSGAIEETLLGERRQAIILKLVEQAKTVYKIEIMSVARDAVPFAKPAPKERTE